MTPPDETPVEAAVYWFSRLRSGRMDDDEREKMKLWIAENENNEFALQELATLWRAMEGIKADPSMLEMRDEATEGLRWRRFRRLTRAAITACILLAIATGSFFAVRRWLMPMEQAQIFATGVGQRSNIVLADGTFVVLDSGASLKVLPFHDERRIELVRGRAFFKVAPRTGMPFIVKAADHSITALGTQFDVDLRPEELRVVLSEGRVRVKSLDYHGGIEPTVDMRAGYRLVLSEAGISNVKVDPNMALSWLKGRLVFDNGTLKEIASELNRYSDRPILVDPSIADRRMSVVLWAGDPQTFLKAAEALELARGVTEPGAYRLIAAE